MTDTDDGRSAHIFFKGVARVPINALNFSHDLFVNHHRPKSEQIVERLRHIFRREGCLRYDSSNWIDAIVDSDHLGSVLARNGLREADLHPDARKFPLLGLGRVDCLQGLHRIPAASALLDPNDSWWTVRLYSSDLPKEACIKIIEGSFNEQPYSDGEIFRRICLYNKENDLSSKRKWMARLTEAKRNDLQQLLSIPDLVHAFDSLADMPGLWCPVKLGTLHRLLTLHCDEEIVRYLSRVSRVWGNILGSSNVPKKLVDRDTVEKLELLAPSASKGDRKSIERLVRSGEVFCDVTDPAARDALLSAILSQTGLIPTLGSFFENLKYLEPCCYILKKILPSKGTNSTREERCTIYQSLSGFYFSPRDQAVEYAERQRRRRPNQDYKKDLWLSYVQLWAFCMRHFPAMTPFQPRKELGKKKPSIHSNVSLWHYLGQLAITLGFKTEQALNLQSQNPHKAFAEQQLRSFCPELTPDTRLVAEIASILEQVEPASEVDSAPRLTCESFLPTERRCGRPFEDDFYDDKIHLFIPFFYENEPPLGHNISPFFVKRDMFLGFFGDEYEKAESVESVESAESARTVDGDDDGSALSAGYVTPPQELFPDGVSAVTGREPDDVPPQEVQQTGQVQEESTHLEVEMLKEEVKEQKTKIYELEQKGEVMQKDYSALVSSSAMEHDQLRTEAVRLQQLLEEATQSLQDCRAKLQENSEELEEVRRQRDDWIEHNDKLATELDNERILQQHPAEKPLEQDLMNSRLQLSKLREDLSEAKEAARAMTEKAKQLEGALEKAKAEAHEDRQAHEEAREKASELKKSLELVGKEANECRLALVKAKVISMWREYNIAKYQERISTLNEQLTIVESMHKQRDFEALERERACNKRNEQLENSLRERERQMEGLEHAIRGLKELMGVGTDSRTDELTDKVKNVNRELQEAKTALCKILEKLEESRRELGVKSDECENLRAELLDAHPPGETVEQDLARAYQDNFRLRVDLQASQNTVNEAREWINQLQRDMEEAKRTASESQEIGEILRRQASEYQEASSVLRYEKSELETALQQAKVESDEVRRVLHEAEKEMTEAKETIAEQKRQLNGMRTTMSVQEAEIPTLRQRLADAEKICSEANEQLKTDLEKCEGQRRQTEAEAHTLRELIGDKAEILKTMTPEGRLLLELLPISLRISGKYVGIFAIDSCTIKMMIGIPEKDGEETIDLVLQAIGRAGTIGELVVTWEVDEKLHGHKLNQTNRTPSYIKRQMLRGRTARFITQSNIEASILERRPKVSAARSEQTRAKRQHTDHDPGEGRGSKFTEWESTGSGKRRKLGNSTCESDRRHQEGIRTLEDEDEEL